MNKRNCFKCSKEIIGTRFSDRGGDTCTNCTFGIKTPKLVQPRGYYREEEELKETKKEEPKGRWEKEKQELWTKTVMERRTKQENDNKKSQITTDGSEKTNNGENNN